MNGDFLYELSDNLRSSDDMIFRKSVFIKYKNSTKANYCKGIFLFESGLKYIDKNKINCFDSLISYKIRYSTNWINDSIHKYYNTVSSEEILINKNKYKKINLNIKVLYIGKHYHYVLKRGKRRKRKIKTYIVYDWGMQNPRTSPYDK
jgi:hypothetical protein